MTEENEKTSAYDWFQYSGKAMIERYSITPDTPDNYLWEIAKIVEENERDEWRKTAHNGEGELILDGTFGFLQNLRNALQEVGEEG